MWTDLKKLKRKLKARMITHENSSDNPNNYIRDSYDKFLEVLASGETKMFEFEIILVQPGITKSRLSEKISNAGTRYCEQYLPIRVFCSSKKHILNLIEINIHLFFYINHIN